MARVRAEISAQELCSIFLPHVTSPTWLAYAETLTAPIRAGVLVAHKGWLVPLAKVAPRLTFTQGLVQEAFANVLANPKLPFQLPEDQLQQWISVMARRVRTMCRHIAQARLKTPKASWILAMCFDESSPPSEDAQEQDDAYTFTYNSEMDAIVRTRKDDGSSQAFGTAKLRGFMVRLFEHQLRGRHSFGFPSFGLQSFWFLSFEFRTFGFWNFMLQCFGAQSAQDLRTSGFGASHSKHASSKFV